jgi:glucokinase
MLTWQAAEIEASRGPEAGVKKISALVQRVAASSDGSIKGIGIGAPGPLDRQHGTIQNPYTLPGWEHVDIVSPIANQFGVLVALENDADAAALGEFWVGAGQGKSSLAMVTIGTGVGTALILNGQTFRGIGGAHQEGGHMIIDPTGPDCYCGAHGCWESLVSGTAIAKFARTAPELSSSILYQTSQGDVDQLTASMVFDAARKGDPLSLRIVDQTARYIALGLVNIIMLYLPDIIVLTGGVVRSYDLLKERIHSVIANHDVVVPAQKVCIQLSQLGQQAGMFGAAHAAQLRCKETQT